MKLYRCQICGDPYLGEEKPKNCPFCGAHERYIVEQKNYEDRIWAIENISDITKNNLEKAIELEVSNAEFYFCASRKAKGNDMKNLFKALGKVEAEHAAVLAKALGIEGPKIDRSGGTCSGDRKADLGEAHMREDNAIHHYAEFLAQAKEPRAIEIFSALIAIESDHMAIHEEYLG